MKQHKLSDIDQKQISHYISQRSLTNIAPCQPMKSTEEYIKIFNLTLEMLQDYMRKVKD